MYDWATKHIVAESSIATDQWLCLRSDGSNLTVPSSGCSNTDTGMQFTWTDSVMAITTGKIRLLKAGKCLKRGDQRNSVTVTNCSYSPNEDGDAVQWDFDPDTEKISTLVPQGASGKSTRMCLNCEANSGTCEIGSKVNLATCDDDWWSQTQAWHFSPSYTEITAPGHSWEHCLGVEITTNEVRIEECGNFDYDGWAQKDFWSKADESATWMMINRHAR